MSRPVGVNRFRVPGEVTSRPKVSQSDFVTRGQSLVAAGQFQEAVKVCRLGLLGRPTTVEGRVVLGQALLALKRFDEVLAEMRVALELDHVSVAAQLLKGEALLRKGDTQAAIEILARVRSQVPSDSKAVELLAEAERMTGKPSLIHPAVGFVGGDTKNYPNHLKPNLVDEDSGPGGYTRPTALSAPVAKKRSNRQPAQDTPAPNVLAVGDRSGTMEVDPSADGLADDDEDLGALASPPVSPKPIIVGAPRAKRPSQAEMVAARRPRARKEVSSVSSVELEPDDLVEVGSHDDDDHDAAETHGFAKSYQAQVPGPGTAVRNAVHVAPGPFSQSMPVPPASRPTAIGQAMPPPLAQQLANQPMYTQPAPLPPPPNSRPMHAAMPPPPMIPPGSPSQTFRASPPPPHNPAMQPTMALSPMQQESAALVDQMFGAESPPPAWARNTVMAQPPPGFSPGGIPPLNPSAGHMGMDPNMSGYPVDVSHGGSGSLEGSAPGSKKTGVRKRSRLQIAVWVTIGALVIGGGVFAGFQIRAMRLGKQIAAARDQATEQAKGDTWQGWLGARENLSRIMSASATTDNRAALARVRGLLAYEFGDGLADAKASVEALANDGGGDGDIAEAYVALAANDAKAAKSAADLAVGNTSGDAGAQYVEGQAELLAGDPKDAVTALKAAADAEPRPLYLLGLARALAASGQIDDAVAATDKALQASAENPAVVITRALILSSAGRLGTTSVANDVHGQLERIVAEGAKPVTDQPHGVSPAQLAFADLALAQVDYARGKVADAIADVNRAAQIQFDDQRFAEVAVDTLYRIDRLDNARTAGENALKQFPSSRRVKSTLASIMIAQGKPNDALDLMAKTADLTQDPAAQVVRGQARAASGDTDGARGDFAAALKKLPNLEGALVGAAWLDLAAGQLDDAKKQIESRYAKNPATASPALATVYAEILRIGGDVPKARAIMEKITSGAQTVDMPRAQLELARIYRDAGEPRLARNAYAEAAKSGNLDARLESGMLLIEDRDPSGGRDTIDLLVKELGDKAPANVLLEGARARMLMGDHPGAKALLDTASKMGNVSKWQLAREKGRLALRQGDYAGAEQQLSRALDGCDDDAETFVLAAETIDGDARLKVLPDKLQKLAPKQLGKKAEAYVVAGLYALTDLGDGTDAAQQAYEKAKEQLATEKASQRRQARAHFGLAIVAISRKDMPSARNELAAATVNDPSLYNAYLYEAQIETKPAQALELANKAVTYNPDSIEGWQSVGVLAAKLGDGKRLAEAISRLGEIGPTTEAFKTVSALRRR
ncbi:MAG TPA: tetratricopeptide repeat protein [Kofleriaceae bacterium]|nr:tetratricopeptide repeat protein [Kofleriaceae bacterium]